MSEDQAPPVIITRRYEDGETIEYVCGSAILYRDYPGQADRLGLSLDGGDNKRRSELREWATLFAHPAVVDAIAGEDSDPEPAPTGKLFLRNAAPRSPEGAISPPLRLIVTLGKAIRQQRCSLNLSDEQFDAIYLIVMQQIESLFGQTPREPVAVAEEDMHYTYGFIAGQRAGKDAANADIADALEYLGSMIKRKTVQE